jgi:hypothetical protein
MAQRMLLRRRACTASEHACTPDLLLLHTLSKKSVHHVQGTLEVVYNVHEPRGSFGAAHTMRGERVHACTPRAPLSMPSLGVDSPPIAPALPSSPHNMLVEFCDSPRLKWGTLRLSPPPRSRHQLPLGSTLARRQDSVDSPSCGLNLFSKHIDQALQR